MGWPVRIDTISLYRGDRWARSWPFYGPPPNWASGHAYVPGMVSSGEYLADSTVSFGTALVDSVEMPVFYTCITAHTAGASFDPTKWVLDSKAVGPPLDLTAYGDTVAGQIRKKQDEAPLSTLDLDASDLAGGQITAALTPQNWADLAGQQAIGWDIEIRAAGELPLTVLTGKFAIVKDWTHA